MHAASREAQAAAEKSLDARLWGLDNGTAIAAQTGTELFDAVEVLDGERSFRVAVADSSKSADARAGLMRTVFSGRVSQLTSDTLASIAGLTWSTPREMREGIVAIGRRALLRAAQRENQLEQVEDELFRLSRILDNEPQLTQLLSDRTATPARKRELLAQVLYGKVTSFTEALALQAIGRPQAGPAEDMVALSACAAQLQDKTVAHVVSAAALSAEQEQTLAAKLGHIYGRAMSIHSEVDPSLLGGMVIRVGDEVIDGSTTGKLARLRAGLA